MEVKCRSVAITVTFRAELDDLQEYTWQEKSKVYIKNIHMHISMVVVIMPKMFMILLMFQFMKCVWLT